MSPIFVCPAHISPHPSLLQPSRAERGQASVEFVGTLPLLALGLFVIIQGFLLGSTELIAQSAAEQYARESTPRREVMQSLPPAWRSGARVERHAGYVRVELRSPVVIPGVHRPVVSAASGTGRA